MAELIVVLVILAIAAALVVPYASGGSSQAVSAARVIASDLQYAQSTAVTTQQPVTVKFTPWENTYTYTLKDSNSLPLIHPITTKSYTVNFRSMRGFENVTIVSAVFGSGELVTFDATGAPDPAGSVTVKAGAFQYRLNVAAATGNVTVTRLGGT